MADITPKAATKKTATKAVAAEPKAAAPKKTTKAAATKTPAAAKTTKKATSAKKGVNPEQRYNMIQEAAYYIAERDGFNGDPMRYWALAEMQIEDMIAAGKI